MAAIEDKLRMIYLQSRQPFAIQVAYGNYLRLLKLLPLIALLAIVMVVIAFIVDNSSAVKITSILFATFTIVGFVVMRIFRPLSDVTMKRWHTLLVDVVNLLFLFWGASMLGYAPNSMISYFDLVIVVLLVGVISLFHWSKLALFYGLTFGYLMLFTPLLELTDSPPIIVSSSVFLFMVFGLYLGVFFYRISYEHHRMTQELLDHQSNLEKLVIEKTKDLHSAEEKLSLEVVSILSTVLEHHDSYTKGHSENVALLAEAIARELKYPIKFQKKLYWAGMLHDIGKTRIAKEVLNKKAELTNEEFAIVENHPEFGYEMVIKSDSLKGVAETILYHHERYDGLGYPFGLQGERIPVEAQIMALADTWDAMRSKRSYRNPLSVERAREELERNKGRQFSPHLVILFLAMEESHQ